MRATIAIEDLKMSIGQAPFVSDWLRIDQHMIDNFAHATGDDAFIHVDPVRAKETRFKGTIAHGLLTLSLLPLLMRTATPLIENARMGVNYGFDKIRFLAPVPVQSDIRAHFSIADISEPKPRFFKLCYDVSIEIDGSTESAASVRWLLGQWVK